MRKTKYIKYLAQRELESYADVYAYANPNHYISDELDPKIIDDFLDLVVKYYKEISVNPHRLIFALKDYSDIGEHISRHIEYHFLSKMKFRYFKLTEIMDKHNIIFTFQTKEKQYELHSN